MSTTEQQLLYWVLNSLSGGELPIKTSIDGTEFLLIVNPNTKKVERIKNNANDTTKLWSQYTGDFTDDSGVLKLGKLDDNLTIQIDSTTNQIELKGLTEIQEARILTDLEVNGDFSTDESVRIKSNNGSLTIEYTENGDFTQTLQAKDGVIATLDDLPDINGFVPYTGASENLDMGANSILTNGIKTNSIEFPEGQTTRITAANTSQLTLLNLPSDSGTIARLEDLPTDDDFVTLDTGQIITGNKNFTGQLTGSNITGDTVRVQTIISKDTGLGAVNLNTIQAVGSSPSFIILDENNNNTVDITLNNTVGDVSLKTPDKDGTLLVDEDLNNTVTFNNQNAIIVNNPDAEEVNGTLTKGEILFTDSSIGTGFKDFSIKKEDYEVSRNNYSSDLVISKDNTELLRFASNATIFSTDIITNNISANLVTNTALTVSNDDGEIQLNDTTSGKSLRINSNLITQDRVLQAPDASGVIALKGNTGWAQYGDTQYTSANPLVITQGTTSIISLDGLTGTVKTQMPSNTTDLFDVSTSKITPIKSGDGYCLSLGFNASTNNNSGDFDIFLDIGGSFTKFKAENKTFPKGSGVVRPFMYNISAFYAGDTFLANGGFIKVTSNTGSTSLFDFDLQIHKTHDAR